MRSLSVAGNSAWVSAQEARRFAYEKAGLNPMMAGPAIVEQCRLGFVTARAVAMKWLSGGMPDGDWTDEGREWDVPIWFWEDFTTPNASSQQWEHGTFSGRGRAPVGYGWIQLNGVHFLRSSLGALLPNTPSASVADERSGAAKPGLSEATLRQWWDKFGPARESLSLERLWALAKVEHPNHFVSRERVRALSDARKTGPKQS